MSNVAHPCISDVRQHDLPLTEKRVGKSCTLQAGAVLITTICDLKAPRRQCKLGCCAQDGFRELLPECAAVVPHWQQPEDSWQGRKDAYLQMCRWRAPGGSTLSFADWDGDSSDPSNFPTAAAAAAEPSPLAMFKVGHSCFPPAWETHECMALCGVTASVIISMRDV